MTGAFYSDLKIELILLNDADHVLQTLSEKENEECNGYVTYNGEFFMAFKPMTDGFRVSEFETFACCVAHLHGGLSEDYLDTYVEKSENDTDENLLLYRNASYSILINPEGVMKVVSFSANDSFDFISGYIENTIGCMSSRDLKGIDIYHDDEFLMNSDIKKQSPSLLLLSERRFEVDFSRDVVFYGRLVLVSHDELGDTIGLTDEMIIQYLQTVHRFTVKNNSTKKNHQTLVSIPF